MRLEFSDTDKTGSQIRGFADKAAKQVKDLWMPFEEKAFARELETDKSKWDEKYFDTQVVYLKTNFSKKRFDHLIAVFDHVWKK